MIIFNRAERLRRFFFLKNFGVDLPVAQMAKNIPPGIPKEATGATAVQKCNIFTQKMHLLVEKSLKKNFKPSKNPKISNNFMAIHQIWLYYLTKIISQ